MKLLKTLFDNNRRWAKRIIDNDPSFFKKLAQQQNPKYLWIGCSDSRVPSNQIIDLMPGEVFVHRNIANMIVHDDINFLAVLQYAVEILKVEHVMVVGHYGCGGIKASMDNKRMGIIDHWLSHIRDVYQMHEEELKPLDELARFDRLCELNIIEQVTNVVNTDIIQNAWAEGHNVAIHGWVYSIENGMLSDLGVTVDNDLLTRGKEPQ